MLQFSVKNLAYPVHPEPFFNYYLCSNAKEKHPFSRLTSYILPCYVHFLL